MIIWAFHHLHSRQIFCSIQLRQSSYSSGEENCEKYFLSVHEKKENVKMRIIAKILETLFVSTVDNRTRNFTNFEILGNAVNIETDEC